MGYPHSWMLYRENPIEMDENWGYPYFRKPRSQDSGQAVFAVHEKSRKLDEGMNKCSCILLIASNVSNMVITVRRCQDLTGIIPYLFTVCQDLVLFAHLNSCTISFIQEYREYLSIYSQYHQFLEYLIYMIWRFPKNRGTPKSFILM